jgi:hypothetical protein
MVEIQNKQFMVYSGKTSAKVFVHRRLPIFNRSMGLSKVEELIEAQRQTNEAENLAIEDLRATTKNVFYTDDPELDGLDLSDLTNLTMMHVSNGKKVGQMFKAQSSYQAIQAYMNQ